jgi:hypothetical protein
LAFLSFGVTSRIHGIRSSTGSLAEIFLDTYKNDLVMDCRNLKLSGREATLEAALKSRINDLGPFHPEHPLSGRNPQEVRSLAV